MRIAVCCKGVPIDAKMESIHMVYGDIHFTDTDFYINEFDAYGLEAALALKKAYGAEIVALTLGPLRVQEVLYIALAKGIDRVVRIDGESSRPEFIAAGLISILKEISPQIILTGVQSEDWMGGEVGVYLSEALHMGMAYAVMEVCELKESQVRIKKEIGGGRKAEVIVKLPAVLCVQSGIQPLRYVSMMKRQKARNTPIQLGGKLEREKARQIITGMISYNMEKVSLPSRDGHAEMISGDRSEMAAKVAQIIHHAI